MISIETLEKRSFFRVSSKYLKKFMKKLLILLVIVMLLMILANQFFSKSTISEKITDARVGSANAFTEYQNRKAENNGRVKIVTGDMGNGTMKVSVQTEDMQIPVLGFSFIFDYPDDALRFIKYERGDFLERGGEPFYMVEESNKVNGKNDRGNGEIVFGSTLKRGDTFPIGDGNIVDFYFKISDPIFDTAGLNFKFKNPIASTLLNATRQDINKIEWVSMAK